MGFLDILADVTAGVSSVSSIVGSVASLYSSYQTQKNVNEATEAGTAQAGRVAQNQETVRQLADAALANVESTTDIESYRRTAGIYRALLAGKEPQELEPFRSQFEEIEYATQAKLRDIDVSAEAARRKIATSFPVGGNKLRALVDIAEKTQDLKAAEIKTARDTIRQKNIELKDKYMTEALSFGREQPKQKTSGYQSVGGILQGYPTGAAASPDAVLKASQEGNVNAGQQVSSIGEEIGKLAKLRTKEPTQPQVTYTYPGTPSPTSAETYISDKREERGLS